MKSDWSCTLLLPANKLQTIGTPIASTVTDPEDRLVCNCGSRSDLA